MNRDASLGVLVPTRNSAALLPAYLRGLSSWLELAEQVVVVDSFSTDNTLELIRQGLQHSALELITHPPGLYASWNAGLRRLKTRYAYIATVGDTITRAGIEQLVAAAERFGGDVIITQPTFLKPDGEEVSVTWPIKEILAELKVTEPRSLAPLEAMVFACAHATGALTGSCASDLFRTEVLQRYPFPTEFGTAGDGVWGLQHAAEVSWVVVPGSWSTFLLHPTAASQSENRPRIDAPRADTILRDAATRWVKNGCVTDADLERIGWTELLRALSDYLDAKAAFDACRRAAWPWSLNPTAWRVRNRRKSCRARLRWLEQTALRAVRDHAALATQTPVGARTVSGFRVL